MKQKAVLELVNERLLPLWAKERKALDLIDRWYRWNPVQPRLPRGVDRELKALLDLARTPWARLAVTTVAQMLYAERVYSSERDVQAMWVPWQRNRMPARQVPLHKAALAYGLAYTTVLPGDSGAVIGAYSPREMLAVYGDPAEDEYPLFAVRVVRSGERDTAVRVLDETNVYFLGKEEGRSVEFIEARPHGVGVCPVVRYANDLDLEGRAPGEVEPLIPIAARINKTDYDRLLAQHFNSWKVRTATGLDEEMSDEQKQKQKMLLRQQDILTGGEGVQFGTLDETPLDGFVKARDSDIEAFAATSQTPPTTYGKLVNVSAEGLVEARASLYAKRDERKVSFGGSHMQTLRLSSHVEKREDDAADFTASMGWADTESRTVNQAVDALGKAAQMLGVPPEVLWDLIPGIDKTQADEWRRYAKEHPTPEQVTADAVAADARRQLAPTV